MGGRLEEGGGVRIGNDIVLGVGLGENIRNL